MAEHPLRREIVTTVLVNEAVNRGGTSFFYRATDETGATWADVLRAYVVVREVYGLRELWAAIEALDNKVPTEAQTLVYLEGRRLIDRAVRWLVSNRRSPIDVPGEIARLRPGIDALLPQLDALFRGGERESLERHADETDRGRPAGRPGRAGPPGSCTGSACSTWSRWRTPPASRWTTWPGSTSCCRSGSGSTTCCRGSPPCPGPTGGRRWPGWRCGTTCTPRWPASPRRCWPAPASSAGAEERVQEWEQTNAASIARAKTAIAELEGAGDLAALSVLLRQIRTLVRTSAAA